MANDWQVWWNKAIPDGSSLLRPVNAYLSSSGSFEREDDYPLFPPVDQVYSDLAGRQFKHPTMHKPPWNFVTYGWAAASSPPPRRAFFECLAA